MPFHHVANPPGNSMRPIISSLTNKRNRGIWFESHVEVVSCTIFPFWKILFWHVLLWFTSLKDKRVKRVLFSSAFLPTLPANHVLSISWLPISLWVLPFLHHFWLLTHPRVPFYLFFCLVRTLWRRCVLCSLHTLLFLLHEREVVEWEL